MTTSKPVRTYRHPLGWLGFALGLALAASCIHAGRDSGATRPHLPTTPIAQN
jgi:hypothetical protein